jgi:hypothetical protein
MPSQMLLLLPYVCCPATLMPSQTLLLLPHVCCPATLMPDTNAVVLLLLLPHARCPATLTITSRHHGQLQPPSQQSIGNRQCRIVLLNACSVRLEAPSQLGRYQVVMMQKYYGHSGNTV